MNTPRGVSLAHGLPYPLLWKSFAEKELFNYIKDTYSPYPAWKKKPFNKKDIDFFSKSVGALSETYHYKDNLHKIFHHARFRSGYLLYFLPLQMAKFCTLFQRYEAKLQDLFKDASETIFIADVGCGPATASLALLMLLLEKPKLLKENQKLHIFLLDSNAAILKDGLNLINLLLSSSKSFQDRVTITLQTAPLQHLKRYLPAQIDLLLAGHVFNELGKPYTENHLIQDFGFSAKNIRSALFLEPAEQPIAQMLSLLRDSLITKFSYAVIGPCLHAGLCPLSIGRNWCHFSVPTPSLGPLFDAFSNTLGSLRTYLKFSFFWIYYNKTHACAKNETRRIISDPMKTHASPLPCILLCEPDQPKRVFIQPQQAQELKRGCLYYPKT